MDWTEVSIITSSEAVEAVSNILMTYGASGVSIEDAKDFEKLTAGKYGNHGEIVDPTSLVHIANGAVVSAYYPNSKNIQAQVSEITDQVKKSSHLLALILGQPRFN